MLNQDTLKFFIDNIYILKFGLFLLSIVFITLVLWEIGLFGHSKVKAEALRQGASADKNEPLGRAKGVIAEGPVKEEEFDPFKALLKKEEENQATAGFVEAPELDRAVGKKEGERVSKVSETIDINDYLGGTDANKTAGEPPRAEEKKEEPSASSQFFTQENIIELGGKEGAAASFDAEKEPDAEKEAPQAQGGDDDPWRAMLQKSTEESKEIRKKSIKIELDKDLGEIKFTEDEKE